MSGYEWRVFPLSVCTRGISGPAMMSLSLEFYRPRISQFQFYLYDKFNIRCRHRTEQLHTYPDPDIRNRDSESIRLHEKSKL